MKTRKPRSPAPAVADQFLSAIHVAIVIGGNVRNEVGGVVQTNGMFSKFDFHKSSISVDSEVYPVDKCG